MTVIVRMNERPLIPCTDATGDIQRLFLNVPPSDFFVQMSQVTKTL